MSKSSFFWIMPFICFLFGYYALFRLVTVDYIETPSLIGLSLSDALKTMSVDRLQGQIVAEKEDVDLAPGVVVDQRPHAGQKVKRSQPICLTVTKRPDPLVAPLCVSLDKHGIEELVAADRIRVKYHELESSFPSGRCYAQYPAPGQEIIDRMLHVYVSRGMSSIRLFPDCKNRPVSELLPFFKSHGITPQLFHITPISVDHDCSYCIVQNQKPLAGTLIDLKRPLAVQLMVVQV
jgi:beta-lactam-binding protein with PASTA domain